MLSARAARFSFARRLATIAVAVLAAAAIPPAAASATVLPTTIGENMTLTAAGSPYTGSSTTISEGVTVTVQPGVLVKLTGTLTSKGTLDVNGTAEKPAVFTSSSDSAPGQWTGISLQAGASASSINHAEVRYAKTGISIGGGISPTIEDSYIHHGNSVGISVTSGGTPEISGNTVADNANAGILFSYTGSSNQLNIHDNLLERNKAGGIRVSPFSTASIAHVDFSGNEVNDNVGIAIDYQGPTIPADIDENSLSGNVKNGIWVSGTVAESTTWEDRGYPFVAHGGGITIAEGATLTLDPGSTIKGEIRGLTVNGTLVADGTETEPITFTSIKDDSVDGDTNGNGAATVPVPGDWPKIEFATSGTGILDHTSIRYGGFSNSSGNYTMVSIKCPCPTPPPITNSVVSHSKHAGIRVEGGGSPQITDNTITHSESGILITAGGAPEIARNTISDHGNTGLIFSYTGSSNQLNIHDNLLERNKAGGIRVSPFSTASIAHVDFSGNEVNDNVGIAIDYQGPTIPADIDENSLSGNSKNGIWVSGTVAASTTWEDRGYPIVSTGAAITVASGAMLTLDPGFTIKGEGRGVNVNGTLVADGTETEPITFTSIKDDSVDGDTNGNGAATVPVPGDWPKIEFATSGTGILDHTSIRYGGFSNSSGNYTMVSIKCPCPTPPPITNSVVSHSKHAGIRVEGGGSPQITDNTITHSESGILITAGGAPEIARNTISDHGNTGLIFSYTGSSNQLNIHDNLLERNKAGGIRVSPFSTASIAHVDFSGNEVNDNVGIAIDYQGPTIPADIDENSLSGNSKNGIWVSGTVAASTTWEDRGYPIVSTGAAITVASGAMLTLDPGFTIKGEGRGVNVNGTLVADGTETEPITFTSIKDDSVDGDTNGNGSGTAPGLGDWSGVFYPVAAGAKLSYVAFHFAKEAVDIEELVGMSIHNSDFVHNEAAIEVLETAENNPELAALPCVPPYLSNIYAYDVWFGETGFPAPAIDLSEVVGAVLPEEYGALFEVGLSLAELTGPLYPAADTIPWAIYSCPELGIPPTPVTPVVDIGIPSEPWFPWTGP